MTTTMNQCIQNAAEKDLPAAGLRNLWHRSSEGTGFGPLNLFRTRERSIDDVVAGGFPSPSGHLCAEHGAL